jgi:zinc protease
MSPVCSRRPRLAAVLGLAALVFLNTSLRAAETAPEPKKITEVEGITEYQLPNGLQILLFPDPSAPKVTVNLTVLVGSRHEGYGETGMAHLLEHMVFKGTPTHKDVPKALRDHGAQFNGSTWVDRTNYFEIMNATDENLEFGIRLEADRLINSYVKREDLISEMTVVRNEFEQGENNPQGILNQRMMAAAYEWHNYGKSTIGNRSDIERVPIERLQAFYHKYYQPDNAVLVVAGKFEPAKALGFITKYFGPLPKPERQLDTTYTEEPAQDGERNVVLRRVGTVGAVGVLYHVPAGPHEDSAAMQVLSTLLTMQPSGRLYQALVATKKVSSVSAFARPTHDPGVFEVMVPVQKGTSPEAIRDDLIGQLEKLADTQFTTEEVERAKRRLHKSRKILMNDPNSVAITLSEWAAQGDWRLFFLSRDRIAKVTPEDVSRVAKSYLRTSNRTVGVYIPTEKPERAAVPETPVLTKILENYKGGKNLVAGESLDPTPAAIEKRLQRSALPSGIKAAVLPKKTRGEAVHLELTLRYGNPDSLKELTSAVQFLGTLMTRGTKSLKRQQIEDELDLLDATLSPQSGLGNLTFVIETDRTNLPAVLTLFGKVLREPSFPQEEFDILKRQAHEGLVRQQKEPGPLASLALQRKLSPYPKEDIRYVPTIDEGIARLDAVTLDQVRRLYNEQLGATSGELVVVGDFDAEPVLHQVTEILNGWSSKVPYVRIERPAHPEVAGEQVVIDTPDKANAFYFAGLTLAMTDTDPDYAALEVGNFLLGGGTLSSRLGNRVRQKEGLSYGVASQFGADARDKAGRFSIFAICNPANIGKVDKAIAEELARLLKDGVEEKELAEAKKAFLEQLKVSRSGDRQIMSLVANELGDGRNLDYYTDLEKKVGDLTVTQVNEALRRHLTPQRLVIVHAGDFKPKGGSEK